ncbi:uncharacterized protein LOC143868681, partial [Tasmannia lanceolata]|uniref:uncharacterized protein LOC143868681 n=1 Tax=Tasmannia lanceolata TaxID=3420 RepID=UPI004063BCAC
MLRQLLYHRPVGPHILNSLEARLNVIHRSARTYQTRTNRGRPEQDQHHKDGNSSSRSDKAINHYPFWGFATLSAVGLTAQPVDYNNQMSPPPPPNATPMNAVTDQQGGFRITWNEFCYQMLARGEVERIVISPGTNIVRIYLHDGAVINGKRPMMKQYFLQVSSIESFENRLREFESTLGIRPGDGVPVIYERRYLPTIIGILFAAGLGYYLYRNTSITGSSNLMSAFTKAKYTLVDPAKRAADSASIKFKDVAGLKEAKVEVMEFVDYLKNPERFSILGAKLPKGVLLTGPPGCGKTLLAKAVATEANVPFLALAGSDFVEMIGGVGASRVRSLFKSANKLAPCIIYIDEIDSIGKQRSGTQQAFNSESEQTLNQLLVEMDGLVARKSVILLASTNRSEVLDKALLRPGRFDRQILIDLPNLEERREIFEKHVSKIKLEKSAEELSHRIAQLTPGMSGADIANVCNEAALHAARKDKKVVSADDLEYAIERVVGGTEKRSSSISAEERRIIAYHESGHALVGWLLEHTDPILKVSIVPRTTNVLGFAQYVPSDRKLYTPNQIFDRMCMALGGRAAELIVFNHLSTGAQDDLKKVSDMAMAQIKHYGFDEVIGNISFPREDPNEMSKRPYSKHLANVIDQRASLLVHRAFETTQQILGANMDKLKLLAENLITKEVMNASDIEQL